MLFRNYWLVSDLIPKYDFYFKKRKKIGKNGGVLVIFGDNFDMLRAFPSKFCHRKFQFRISPEVSLERTKQA